MSTLDKDSNLFDGQNSTRYINYDSFISSMSVPVWNNIGIGNMFKATEQILGPGDKVHVNGYIEDGFIESQNYGREGLTYNIAFYPTEMQGNKWIVHGIKEEQIIKLGGPMFASIGGFTGVYIPYTPERIKCNGNAFHATPLPLP